MCSEKMSFMGRMKITPQTVACDSAFGYLSDLMYNLSGFGRFFSPYWWKEVGTAYLVYVFAG